MSAETGSLNVGENPAEAQRIIEQATREERGLQAQGRGQRTQSDHANTVYAVPREGASHHVHHHYHDSGKNNDYHSFHSPTSRTHGRWLNGPRNTGENEHIIPPEILRDHVLCRCVML